MSKVINISGEQEFKQKVVESKMPVLVDFWASWCVPCRMMAPVLDKISDKFDGELVVAKVNTEEPNNQTLPYIFGIQSIPNMKYFFGGKITNEFLGFRPEDVFTKEIEETLSKTN